MIDSSLDASQVELDGATVDGGAIVDGATVDGATVDGATVDGATVDGATVDGATVDGATVDGGASLDGAMSVDASSATDAAAVATCFDGVRNGDETCDDGGGSECRGLDRRCAVSEGCVIDGDCVTESNRCVAGVCFPAACDDGRWNGLETCLDGGGAICRALEMRCADGEPCAVDDDCESRVCTSGTCAVPTCRDGRLNGAETGTDCGGPCEPCSLVAEYSFDGDLSDSSRFGNTAVLPGGSSVVCGLPGRTAPRLACESTSTAGSLVIPDAAHTDVVQSVDAWVMLPVSSSVAGSLLRSSPLTLTLTTSTGRARITATVPTSAGTCSVGLSESSSGEFTERWAHVAVVISASSVSLYVDGALRQSTSCFPIPVTGTDFVLLEGTARIDDLRLWSAPLTAAEVCAASGLTSC